MSLAGVFYSPENERQLACFYFSFSKRARRAGSSWENWNAKPLSSSRREETRVLASSSASAISTGMRLRSMGMTVRSTAVG